MEMETVGDFMNGLEDRMTSGRFIGNADIEFVRQWNPERADVFAKYRQDYYNRKHQQEEERRKQREKEDMEYTLERNAEAERVIQAAIDTIRNGNGKVENCKIEFFKNRYQSTTSATV